MDKIGSSNCTCTFFRVPARWAWLLQVPVAHSSDATDTPFTDAISPSFPAVFWSFPSQRGAIVSCRLAIPQLRGRIKSKIKTDCYYQQMQNRLDAAREARAASERQLAEVQAAIAAERAARPESVRLHSLRFFVLSLLSAGIMLLPTCRK